MRREALLEEVRNNWGIEPEYPFEDDHVSVVLREPSTRKWFAVLMRVSGHLVGCTEDTVDIMNVKCSPLIIPSLTQQPGFRPCYHMSKVHWVTILMNDEVPEAECLHLLEESRRLVAAKKKKSTPRKA